MSLHPEIDKIKIRQLVVDTFADAHSTALNEEIFGGSSSLDSLGLVNFLSDLEYRIAEEFGQEVVLASEKAMSRSHSPFRNVTALSEYVEELLKS